MHGKLTFFIRLKIARAILLIVFAVGCCLPYLFAQNPDNSADYRLLNSGVKANAEVFITTDKTLTSEKVTAAPFQEFYTSAELHQEIIYYIFIGGMSLMIFYFAGIYFIYKDKLFLLYMLYLLALLLYLGFKASYF